MKRYISIITILLTLCYFSSCDQKQKSEKTNSKNELVEKHDSLRARVDSVWAIIDSNNKDLSFTIERMLKEIEWTNLVNLGDINAQRKDAEKLKNYYYSQKTIPVPSQIDKDFASVDSIVIAILTFASETPEREKYGLIDQLSLEIQEHISPSSSFILGHYSERVFEYNEFIIENKKALKDAGIDAEPLPAFTTPDEEVEDNDKEAS